MKKITLLFVLAGTILFAQAQNKLSVKSKKAIALYQEAIQDYKSVQVNSAIAKLEQAIITEPKFIEAYLLKAEVHDYAGEYNSVIDCYNKVMEIDSMFHPYLPYNMGKAYMNIGEYEKSKNEFLKFITRDGVRIVSVEKAKLLAAACDSALLLINNPVEFNPEKLSDSINSNIDEYWPSVSADGSYMVYTRLLTDSTKRTLYGNYGLNEDIFISRNVNGEWTKGKPIEGRLNTENNDGAPKISADGKVIVFTACNRNDGYGMCDIYFSFWSPEGWSKPVNAGPAINTRYSEKQPALSPDNRKLYFTSNRPEGEGEFDIWCSEQDFMGYWQKPVNLGSDINTYADEMAPFIHADNRTMYFSSNKQYGLGMHDIYTAKKDSTGKWINPKNIGYPINTHQDEIGLILNSKGDKAYYSSGNKGERNIYSFTLPKNIRPTPALYVSGKIYDIKTKEPLKALFSLVDLSNGDTVMQSESEKETGEYLVCLPTGEKYLFNADCEGYLFHSSGFSLDTVSNLDESFILNIGLQKIEKNERIVLNNVFFAHNSYELLKESFIEIEKLNKLIKNNPQLLIEIGGYTDNTASDEYNKELSLKRAKAVWEALKIPAELKENITYKGYGEENPVGDNNTAQGRAKNRRTELKIIGVK